MFIAMAEDLRVIFVKLSDRLHNMKTLKFHPKPEKREKIAIETLNIYAPIADRLGLFAIKNSLEEECFKILEPESYKELKRQLREIEPQRRIFMKNVLQACFRLGIILTVVGFGIGFLGLDDMLLGMILLALMVIYLGW